jgi:hypothetical protein
VAATALVVLGVVAVVLWQLHLPLLLSDTTTTGGDTGAHFMMPAFFNSHLFPHLTGWDPSWYAGYPDYTFYFVLPDALIALAAHVIPYDVAFKLGTVAGSVLLPLAAWALGRLFGLRRPVPAALAAATLPFLFDYTWTIYGGNLFSTLAGEYAYSLSIAFLLLFLGLFARGVRTGAHRILAALALAACLLAHVVPGLFAVVGAGALLLVELLPARALGGPDEGAEAGPHRGRAAVLWWGLSTTVLGLLLAAWWLVPFGLRLPYATSMNYAPVTTYRTILFPSADLWALALAAVAVVVAVATRSRFGMVVSFLGGCAALVVVADPLRSLYNVRFLPLWFLAVYLMVGWLFGVAASTLVRRARRWRSVHAGPGVLRPPMWAPGAVGGALGAIVAAIVVVVPPFVPALASSLPDLGVVPGANQVSVWAHWNYTGYEGKADYPEYRGLMTLMAAIGRRHGCGRAMWEYNSDQNRFGTPEALMLLPYWTRGCIDSMEGLLFESSGTTPFHFLNQAELSVGPSEPVVGLPYGALTVDIGVKHLQLLGVRYFMAQSPQVEEEAAADPTLRLLATSGPWRTTYEGAALSTTWKVYEIAHSPLVQPLSALPARLRGVGESQNSWLGRLLANGTMAEGPSLSWYLDPAAWRTELVQGGAATWPTAGAGDATHPPLRPVTPTTVRDVRVGTDSVSFRVDRLGRPVLVKVSYFPNWHVRGAEGPWRATPDLMVVVPTSHHVVLTYGTTDVTVAGDAATAAGILAVVVGVATALLRRRRSAR